MPRPHARAPPETDRRGHPKSSRAPANGAVPAGGPAAAASPTGAAPHAAILEGLQEALATTFTLYRDTHLAHFNVRGPSFPQLHALFEAQYQEVWQAVDEVAERIRALGHLVTDSALAPAAATLPGDAQGMLAFLVQAHRDALAQWSGLFDACEAARDHATADLCNARVRAHQKHAWMLEATASPVRA